MSGSVCAASQVRSCSPSSESLRSCKCGNLILFFFLLHARNFERTSSEIDEIEGERRGEDVCLADSHGPGSGTRILKVLAHSVRSNLFEQNQLVGCWSIDGIKFVRHVEWFQWLVATIVPEFVLKTSLYNPRWGDNFRLLTHVNVREIWTVYFESGVSPFFKKCN